MLILHYWTKIKENSTKLTHSIPDQTSLYLLKTSENQKIFEVFRRYRNRTLAWKGLSLFFLLQELQQACKRFLIPVNTSNVVLKEFSLLVFKATSF